MSDINDIIPDNRVIDLRLQDLTPPWPTNKDKIVRCMRAYDIYPCLHIGFNSRPAGIHWLIEKLKKDVAVASKLRRYIVPELACRRNVVAGIGDIMPVNDYIKALRGTVIDNRPQKIVVVIIRVVIKKPGTIKIWLVRRINGKPDDPCIPAG